jgi:hypothetical protein
MLSMYLSTTFEHMAYLTPFKTVCFFAIYGNFPPLSNGLYALAGDMIRTLALSLANLALCHKHNSCERTFPVHLQAPPLCQIRCYASKLVMLAFHRLWAQCALLRLVQARRAAPQLPSCPREGALSRLAQMTEAGKPPLKRWPATKDAHCVQWGSSDHGMDQGAPKKKKEKSDVPTYLLLLRFF